MQALGFFFILHRLHSLHYHAASWELVFGTPRFFRMPTHSYSASPRPTRGGRTWRTSLAKSDGSRGAVRWPEQSRSARSNMQSVVKHSPATSTHLGTVGRVRPAGVGGWGQGAGCGSRRPREHLEERLEDHAEAPKQEHVKQRRMVGVLAAAREADVERLLAQVVAVLRVGHRRLHRGQQVGRGGLVA